MSKLLKTNSFVRPLHNERGVVLVMSMLLLVILSLLGALSLRIANNEVLTAGNSEESIMKFYMLEGVGLEGVARLEYQNDGSACPGCRVEKLYNVKDLAVGDLVWLDEVYSVTTTAPDLTIIDNWASASTKALGVADGLSVGNQYSLEPLGYDESLGDRVRYALQDNGRTGIYSIGSSDPVIRGYEIYGLYDVKRGSGKAFTGKGIVEMGYRMELEEMDVL
jgi:Tfp pilus assembly protein PilX